MNDESQSTFVSQPTLDMLELKEDMKVMIMFLVENQREYIILNSSHYILLYMASNFLDIKCEKKIDKDVLPVE